MATGVIQTNNPQVIFNEKNIPTSFTSYNCDWQNYKTLFITGVFYANRLITVQTNVPSFGGTGSGNRPIIYIYDNTGLKATFEVYQNGSGKVMVKSNALSDSYGLVIEGMN